MKQKLKNIFTLFFVFMKIGAFAFGGGYAMIPFIEREIVDQRKYIDKKDVMEILAVAGTMPGSVAVNMATFVGYRTAGFAGALTATLGNVLPAFTLIFLISFLLRQFREIEVVRFALDGVLVAVVALILKALLTLFKQSPKGAIPYLIMGSAFLCVAFLGVNAICIIIASAAIGLAASLLAARGKVREDKKK